MIEFNGCQFNLSIAGNCCHLNECGHTIQIARFTHRRELYDESFIIITGFLYLFFLSRVAVVWNFFFNLNSNVAIMTQSRNDFWGKHISISRKVFIEANHFICQPHFIIYRFLSINSCIYYGIHCCKKYNLLILFSLRVCSMHAEKQINTHLCIISLIIKIMQMY